MEGKKNRKLQDCKFLGTEREFWSSITVHIPVLNQFPGYLLQAGGVNGLLE